MKRSKGMRLSPEMVVALTALVFAMTGAGYAATQLSGPPAKAAKKKVRRGPAGPPGQQGIQGVPGANGATNVTTRTTDFSVPGANVATGIAYCNAGEHATGGGYRQITGSSLETYVSYDAPQDVTPGSHPTSWAVTIYNSNASSRNYTAFVECAAP